MNTTNTMKIIKTMNTMIIMNPIKGNIKEKEGKRRLNRKSGGRIAAAGLISILLLGNSVIPAMAGVWQRDSNGWMYLNDDYSFSRDCLQNINGDFYIFDNNGYMQSNGWFKLGNGGWYYCIENGAVATNQWIGDYYVGSDGEMLINTTTPDGYKVGTDGRRVNSTGTAAATAALPAGLNDLVFSSGAGAWETRISIQPDGSFAGEYHDSDMGDAGAGYPNGTYYISQFNGKFTNISKVKDGIWSMTLENISINQAEGVNWIDDGIKYIASAPYGLEAGEVFLLYAPGTAVNDLSEELLSWWPGRFDSSDPKALTGYCLYNVEKGYGFFQ